MKIRVFYDGECGLCHFFVRFSLKRMSVDHPLYFSPIKGQAFKKISERVSSAIDSVVVYDENKDRIYIKFAGVLKVFSLLKSPWRVLFFLLRWIPIRVGDFFYDLIAKTRRKLFKKPEKSCPYIGEEWKKFFED